jgi:hypothetical protein
MPLKINHYPKGLEVLRIYDPQKKKSPNYVHATLKKYTYIINLSNRL